jgi:hypothetical protein
MAKFVGARVYNSGNLTISTSSDTILTFDSENFDSDSIHSTVTNTGRLTCNTAGIYVFHANVLWASNATGRRRLLIWLNATTIIASLEFSAVAAVDLRQCVMGTYEFAATDYITVNAWQNSGGNLNITQNGQESPIFGMRRIG